MPRSPESFYAVVSAAIKDFAEHGFDSTVRLDTWLDRIRHAAALSLTPQHVVEEQLKRTLMNVYTRMVEKRAVLKMHRGVPRFTLDKVRPELRAELDRRVAASANLIKLHRQEAIDVTLRRFSGWASSVPAGGSDAVEMREEGTQVRKALAQLDFVQRRVAIDQGHKLVGAINEVVAVGGGAIALIWHSHWRQRGYNYREDHKERDGHVYLLPRSWALDRAYVKPGPSGWYDNITAVGEEPFCRCYAQYLYALRDLPPDMLTRRGAEALADVRGALARVVVKFESVTP